MRKHFLWRYDYFFSKNCDFVYFRKVYITNMNLYYIMARLNEDISLFKKTRKD